MTLRLSLVALAAGALLGCSDDPASPGNTAGSGGSGGAATCELGAPLPDGTCITAGVPPELCGEGFLPDGKQGCEPILPADDCPDGTMPVIGQADCQPVGVPAALCAEGFLSDGTGGCEPILPIDECPEGSMAVIGTSECQSVGVPADQCAEGFSFDGTGGCEPILPSSDCPAGQMAVPGEMVCHEPQSCGMGTWGDIPVELSTQFVDASYGGGDSDGSMAKPWLTIAEGVSAASPGAVVAVAAGSYAESLSMTKGVRLWGVCPSKVSVIGAGASVPTLRITALPSAQSLEVHGLGISGLATGIEVSGAKNVTLAGLWIHHTGGTSFGLELSAKASVTVISSLLESLPSGAMTVYGATADVTRTVIRNILPQSTDQKFGRGIEVYFESGQRGALTLTSSVIDHTHDVGLFVSASDTTVLGSVIRNTQPRGSDMGFGIGIQVGESSGRRAVLTLTSSLLDQNHEDGVSISGADATVQGTVIRNTQPRASNMQFGLGIQVKPSNGERGKLTLSASQLDHNHSGGVGIFGSDATIEGAIIRNTQPQVSSMLNGRGISVQTFDGGRGTLTMTSSLLDQNHEVGLYVGGSDATVHGTVIRNTQPQALDNTAGRGIHVQKENEEASVLALSSSLLERNHTTGLGVFGAEATVVGSIIRNTQPQASDMLFGYGVTAQVLEGARGALTLTSSLLDQNTSVGLSVGGADATVLGTMIRDTQARSVDMKAGMGIQVRRSEMARGNLTLTSSLLERNHHIGLTISGSDVALTGTIIRNTQPRATDMTSGRGINVQASEGAGSVLTLTSSLLDNNREVGLYVGDSDVTLEGTVIRNTQPRALDETGGRGIQVENFEGVRGTLKLNASLLEQNHEVALGALGSDVTVQNSVIRNTQPPPSTMLNGIGITGGEKSTLTLTSSMVDQSHGAGVFLSGSDATLLGAIIRNTQPQVLDGSDGTGVGMYGMDGDVGVLTLTSSLIEQSYQVGLYVSQSQALVQGTLIQNTKARASDDAFGDGVVLVESSPVTLVGSVLRSNQRASISNFGSVVVLRQVSATCSAILFDQEIDFTNPVSGEKITFGEASFAPEAVSCGTCDGSPLECTVVSKDLGPPSALPSLGPSKPSETLD